jgi:putative transposase
VHYLPKQVRQTDPALTRRIDELHLEHKFVGTRMLRVQLIRLEYCVGGKHVAKLIFRMGIAALAPQPGTSKRCLG